MRKNLYEFLFGRDAIRESSRNLGDDVVKLFEEAADEEVEQMTANKKPLAAALKSLGISAKVTEGPQACEVHFDNEADYRECTLALSDPDAMHKLAELGWVTAVVGDTAMNNQVPDFKIGFIELTTAGSESENKQEAENLETIRKNAQKFASTPLDRDDDMNPVKNDLKSSDDGQKGVGKAADGKNPEGKPKGVKEAVSAKQLASHLLDEAGINEMTGCAAIPATEGAPLGIAGNRFRAKKKNVNTARKPNR